MNANRLAAPFVILSALFSGCASITDGTSQTIAFNLSPKETRCVVSREGTSLGTINGRQNTLTVGKGARDLVVQCSAEGHEDVTHRLVSKTQTSGVVGGFFLDLGITDMITGAMWKYPNDISIVLQKSPVAARGGSGAPRS